MVRKTNKIKPQKYDAVYIDPSIDKVIEAISNQNNEQKTVLVFRHNLNHSDSFQLTETFPSHFFQLLNSAKKRRLLKALFLLSPHLVHPQKVIYNKSGGVKWMAKITDLVLKNQLGEKSTLIDQKVSENLSFLKISNLNGVVFQEYKINVSRLLIELLKYFETIGGKVEVNSNFDAAEISTIIQEKPIAKIAFITNIKSPSNFALSIQNKKNRFRLFKNNNLLQIESLNDKNQKCSTIEIQKEIENIVDLNSAKITAVKLSPFLYTKTVSNILETIKSPLPSSFKNATIKDNYELSLEKFDIAKQTGITYPEFKILFHRYGTGIDEMIDEAYEKMNKIRDAKKIWEEVEIWFQQKKEWKV